MISDLWDWKITKNCSQGTCNLPWLKPGTCFSKVWVVVRAQKAILSFLYLHSRSKCLYLTMIQWNNQLMKQNWARNCATIQQVLILKFAFRPEKLVGLSRSRPQGSKKIWVYCQSCSLAKNILVTSFFSPVKLTF